MKKILLAAVGLFLAAGVAVLVWQNLPQKRFARHISKARLYVQEKNFTAARIEYEKGHNITGKYTPYVSYEVLRFTNQMNIQENRLGEALANTKIFVQRAPNSKEARVVLAELAFRSGEVETAFDAVHAAIDMDPDYFPSRLLLTQVRTRQGRLDLAEEQLRYLYKSHPDSLRALLPLAENLLRQGQLKEGREFLTQAIHDHPDNATARLLLLDSYLAEGKADSAQAALDTWSQTDPSLALPILVRKAQIHSLSHRFASAESLLTPQLKADEEHLSIYGEYALLQAKQVRYDSAIKYYAAYRDIQPSAAGEAMRLSVYLNLKNNTPAKALELLKTLQISARGGELMPLLAATYLALGQENKIAPLAEELPDSLRPALLAFTRQMHPDREFIGQWALINYFSVLRQPAWAAMATQELYTKWPQVTLAQVMWAAQLAGLRRYAEAAKLIEKQPDQTMARKAQLLGLYLKGGAPEKALALAEKMLAEKPDQKGLNLFLADYYMSHGNKAKSTDYYERELALDSTNTVCLNNLAWEYGIERGDLAKAQPFLDRLQRMPNRDPRIMDTIGWILARNGKPGEAVKLFESALDLVPDYPSFHYHLGWTLSRMGNKAEAKKHLESALSSKAVFVDRENAQKLLAEQG